MIFCNVWVRFCNSGWKLFAHCHGRSTSSKATSCNGNIWRHPSKRADIKLYNNLRNRSALAVNCWVINHCLEISCNVDYITSLSDISTYNWPTNSDLWLKNSLLELIYLDSNTKKTFENEFWPCNCPNLNLACECLGLWHTLFSCLLYTFLTLKHCRLNYQWIVVG